MIFCARATRGRRLPSLDARSGRSISPHIETMETVRVSVDDFGKQGNGECVSFSPLNRNGHYIAFGSYASNLVLSDLNGMTDSFIYERRGDNLNESPKHDVKGFDVDNEFDD